MKRYEQQTRPTAGCLSVPLFNQKKRSRLPLTSNPSENEFCSSNEYMSTGSASSNITLGNSGYYQNQAQSCPAPATQNTSQWNRQVNPHSQQQYVNSRPAPRPVGRGYTPMPHPFKPGNTGSQIGQQQAKRQDSRTTTNLRQSNYPTSCSSGNTQNKPVPPSSYSEMGQQSAYRQANPPEALHSLQPRPPPPNTPIPGPQQQNTSWKFKSTPNTGPPKQITDTYHTQTTSQPQTPSAFRVKPVIENSLRILTAVIDGMRHWSQFKDRAPYLFEIFATLDSAVTTGSHGAKNFLIRDGKEVVRCVFFENEVQLPRLIRGQVHRCVGNYDRARDVLTCVSVRATLPSEQRNAHESVKVSDAEMRALVKSLSEV